MARLNLLCLASALVAAAAPSGDPWPMFLQSTDHHSNSANAPSGYNIPVGELTAAWTFNMSHQISSTPTLIGELVIAASGCGDFPCTGGDIVAFYRDSGKVKWSTPLGTGVAYSSPMPSKDGKLVYIGTDAGKVVAVSVENGTVVHSYTTGGNVTGTPCVAPIDGAIYVGSYDGNMYKLDAKLNLVWKSATKGQVWSSPTISDDGELIFFGGVDYGIYGVYTATGLKKWVHNTTGRVKAAAVYDNGQVLVGNYEDKCLRCLDAHTGEQAWRFTAGDFVFSAPAISGDKYVVLSDTDKYVYGLTRTSGKMLWKTKLPGYVDSSPVIAGDKVIVGCDNDGSGVVGAVLHVLDLDTGKILSTFSDMAETESSAAVGSDGIYIGSMDGGLRKIV